jgi:hypothetical protein
MSGIPVRIVWCARFCWPSRLARNAWVTSCRHWRTRPGRKWRSDSELRQAERRSVAVFGRSWPSLSRLQSAWCSWLIPIWRRSDRSPDS